MAIAIVFVKLKHILPMHGGKLIDTKFANIYKSVRLDNKKDM